MLKYHAAQNTNVYPKDASENGKIIDITVKPTVKYVNFIPIWCMHQ